MMYKSEIGATILGAPNAPADRSVPIYSWLGVSNYTPVRNDFIFRGTDFNYQIVLLPGYSRPRSLDRNSLDAIWFDGVVTEPTVVWDGRSSSKLFEIISECMDPRFERGDFIKVRSKSNGRYVTDFRSQECLKSRPFVSKISDILSHERFVEKERHVEEVIDHYMTFSRIEKDTNYLKLPPMYRRATSHCPTLLRDNLGVWYGEDYKRNKIERRQFPEYSVDGLKFGYDRYIEQKSKYPEWAESAIELKYLIENSIIKDKDDALSFIRKRRIPDGVISLTD